MTARRDWSRVVAADRKRKRIEVTLSDAARTRLQELTAAHPSKVASRVVEDLVMSAKLTKGATKP